MTKTGEKKKLVKPRKKPVKSNKSREIKKSGIKLNDPARFEKARIMRNIYVTNFTEAISKTKYFSKKSANIQPASSSVSVEESSIEKSKMEKSFSCGLCSGSAGSSFESIQETRSHVKNIHEIAEEIVDKLIKLPKVDFWKSYKCIMCPESGNLIGVSEEMLKMHFKEKHKTNAIKSFMLKRTCRICNHDKANSDVELTKHFEDVHPRSDYWESDDENDVETEEKSEEANTSDKNKTRMADENRLKKLFHELDANKDGRIDIHELTEGLRKLGCFHITEEQILELMRKSDISKSGDLDLHEFVTYLTDHEKQLRFTFEALDEDQDGKIGVNEVISAFKKSGIVITESEAKSLMQKINVNDHSSDISFEEWRDYLLFHPSADLADIISHWRHNTDNSSIISQSTEAKKKVEEEAQLKAKAEAKKKEEEEEARLKAEAEAKKKVEEEARLKAEAEGEKTEGHDKDENMEQKDDQQDQPKLPEDEEKRARQDEHFENPETELENPDREVQVSQVQPSKKRKMNNVSNQSNKKAKYNPNMNILMPENVTSEMLQNIAKHSRNQVYCKDFGTACHECRQKTLDQKTICRSGQCSAGKGHICGPCLYRHHGQKAEEALLNKDWWCPHCLNNCPSSLCKQKNSAKNKEKSKQKVDSENEDGNRNSLGDENAHDNPSSQPNIPSQRIVQSGKQTKRVYAKTLKQGWLVHFTKKDQKKKRHYWKLDTKRITLYRSDTGSNYYKKIPLSEILAVETAKKGATDIQHCFEIRTAKMDYYVEEDANDSSDVDSDLAEQWEITLKQALMLETDNVEMNEKSEPVKITLPNSPKKFANQDLVYLKEIQTLEEVQELSVKQAKDILAMNQVNFKDVVEKDELLKHVSRLWKQEHKAQAEKDQLPDFQDELINRTYQDMTKYLNNAENMNSTIRIEEEKENDPLFDISIEPFITIMKNPDLPLGTKVGCATAIETILTANPMKSVKILAQEDFLKEINKLKENRECISRILKRISNHSTEAKSLVQTCCFQE